MSPLEALEAELCAEVRALARRLGAGQMPEALTFRVEMDRTTGMPRSVECEEHRARRILVSGAIAKERRAC